MLREKLPTEENKDYRQDIQRFEKTKERSVSLGIFDRKFIDGLNIYIATSNMGKGHKNIPCVTLDNKAVVIKQDKFNYETDVIIPSASLIDLDKIYTDNKEGLHNKIWFEGIDFKNLYSFDAATIHEIAHAKSFQLIPPAGIYEFFSGKMKSHYFNQEKFLAKTKEIIEHETNLQKLINVDFSKFNFSLRSWTEIYAFLYQREFLRMTNPDNESRIQEWDKHVLEAAEEMGNMIINKELSPDKFYKNHVFSFLLAAPLEENFKDFNERIKFLESFKKND